MHDSSFGKEIFVLGISLSGDMSADRWEKFLPELYAVTGLRPSHEGRAFDYTAEEYGEYLGFIHIQPIITSFIVLDSWPNLGGGYLHICSCKPLVTESVLRLLRTKYTVLDSFYNEMGL